MIRKTISDNSYYEKKNDKVYDITEDIPKCIGDSFIWVRLNDICSSIFAGGDRPSEFSKDKTAIFNVPVYSNGIENNGLFGYTNKAKVFEKCLTVSARGTIGFTCVRENPFVPIVRLITILPLRIVDVDYLNYMFMLLPENGEGTSTPQLTVPGIKDKLIPICSISYQKKIVNKLNNIFSCVENIKENSEDISNYSSLARKKILEYYFSPDSTYKSYYKNTIHISEIFTQISTINKEIKIKDAKDVTGYPVVSQSAKLIDGYYDNLSNVITDVPIIIFGDHTRIVKYIDFEFIPGADGTKILKAKNVLPKYLYYCSLYASNIIENRGYGRHFAKFKNVSIPDVSIEEQKKIVNYIDNAMVLLDSIY